MANVPHVVTHAGVTHLSHQMTTLTKSCLSSQAYELGTQQHPTTSPHPVGCACPTGSPLPFEETIVCDQMTHSFLNQPQRGRSRQIWEASSNLFIQKHQPPQKNIVTPRSHLPIPTEMTRTLQESTHSPTKPPKHLLIMIPCDGDVVRAATAAPRDGRTQGHILAQTPTPGRTTSPTQSLP